MICPRCSVAEISEASNECLLCGYSMERKQTVGLLPADELDERVRAELRGDFHVERELRRSNESRTYLAKPPTGDQVSLTVIPRTKNKTDPALEARFRRAVQVGASLDHPHIVPIYTAGRSATLLWCSAKFVEARSLAELLGELDPLDLSSCRRLVEQIASALDHAHRRGISHGDVSAEPVLVDAHGWALLTHFGIVQALRGVSLTRQGGPSGDQRDLAALVARCLNLDRDPSRIPGPVVDAVQRAAGADAAARYPTVLDFVAALSIGAAPGLVTQLAPPTPPKRKTPTRVLLPTAPSTPPGATGRRRWWVIAAFLTLGVLTWLLWPRRELAVVPYSTLALPREAPPSQSPPTTPLEREPSVQPEAAAPPGHEGAVAQKQPPPARPHVSGPAPRAGPPVSAGNGKLFVNSTPWGQVYLDGVFAGNTPQVDLAIPAGPHLLRVVRDGFLPYERQILVAAGKEVRLTDLVLSPR